ncbi:hypothetical protein BDP55DRAFT_139926 [Colletotrichum godetiae]|uniref:Uncharacterized protein n=1 Tax=Colletotrichum godetiae TaxID=1209918 RepID=A0AAJ0AYR5_9PEZI|nr:uncharacterized protein BDP55DRAFT_139926 [Colletotrichum godetiae]KAK1700698.1 hypothetical protein BDP55DRAFT_139926 [Colletotrichum godetiae]
MAGKLSPLCLSGPDQLVAEGISMLTGCGVGVFRAAAYYTASAPQMDRYLRSPMELPERLVSIGNGTSSTRTSSSSRQQTQRSLTAWDARWTQAGQSS